MTAEQKIDAWYKGTRGMNLGACSDDKVVDYYIWNIKKGYFVNAYECLCELRKRKIYFHGFRLVENCEPLNYQKLERFFANYKYYSYDEKQVGLKQGASQRLLSYSPHVSILEYGGNSVKIGEQFIDTATGSIDYIENPVEAFNKIIDTLFTE